MLSSFADNDIGKRADGLGIHLTAADTCIIYDSDRKPQQDLQVTG